MSSAKILGAPVVGTPLQAGGGAGKEPAASGANGEYP